MPHRQGEWAELDDMMAELDSPAVRLVEGLLHLRVSDCFFVLGVILSSVLFLYAPQPSAQVSQRFAATIVGAPSPAHSKARNQTPPIDWDLEAKEFAASALDSISHVYANSA